ncbi:MAG TPA: hypothetical protein VGP26_14620 [Actinophytocola sp.]|jgi:hypothetical protein|nr:hypothetical protein [Actinophytocola sp.]
MSGERTIRIKIDGDGKGLIVTARTVEKEVDRLGKKVDDANHRFTGMAGGFAKVALKASALSSVTNTVAGLGSTIATASGALLGLPAVAAAGAAALLTVALGADGIKRAFAGLGVSLGPLQAQVSATFEQGLAPAVDDLNRLLPQTAGGFSDIAREMAGVVSASVATAVLPKNTRDLNNLLGQTSGFMGGVRAAAGPLTQALIDVVSVGSEGFTSVGDRIAASSQEFAGFIARARASGQLREWLDNGIAALKDMWQTLKDIGAIVKGVFEGISDGAGGISASFGPAIRAMREFVESTGGQQFLRQIGGALAEVGEAVGGVLSAGLRAVAPLVGPLAQAFAMMATAASGILIPALAVLAPILEAIGNFMAENEEFVRILVTALGGLGAAYLAVHGSIKLVSQATTLWSTVSSIAANKAAGLGTSFSNMSRVAKIASLSMGAIGVVLAVVGTAMSLFGGETGEATAKQQQFRDAGKEVNDVIREQGGVINNAVRAKAADKLENSGILENANKLGIALPQVTDAYLQQGDALPQLRDRLEEIVKAHTHTVTSGRSSTTVLDEQAEAAKGLLGDINGLVGGRDSDAAATDRETAASKGSTNAVNAEIAARQALQNALLALTNVEIGYQQAVDDATKAAKENTGGLNANKTAFDLSTQAGRNKATALDDLVVKSNAYVAKLKEQKASTVTVDNVTNNATHQFIRVAGQMGITGDRAVQLAARYGLIPRNITTVAQLRGWEAAQRNLAALQRAIDNIPRTVTVSTFVRGANINGSAGHQFVRATGGPVLPGRSYVVGERGPEIFRAPNTGGTIVPNHDIGGGDTHVFVSIDGQQLEGRIVKVVRENNRSIRRSATAGTGGAR